MSVVVALMMTVACLAGVALTLGSLPGTWVMVAAALLVQWGWPGTFSWPLLGAVVGLAVLAEVAEFAASGVGARQAGGSRRSAAGAISGGLIGALIGTVLIPAPIVGTIVGAALGAGALATVAELTAPEANWRGAWRVGRGAAVGRLIAVVVKTAFALAMAATLIAGAVVG